MTARAIAPVIPPRPRPGSVVTGRPGSRPLPLAVPPPAVPRPCEAVYGTGRIDASGRIAGRAVTGALGWDCGDRLTITAGEGAVIARRDPRGMVTLGARSYLAIPPARRRRCGLRPAAPLRADPRA